MVERNISMLLLLLCVPLSFAVDVCIIGGGMAGVAAAEELLSRNNAKYTGKISIIEARSDIGGRLFNSRLSRWQDVPDALTWHLDSNFEADVSDLTNNPVAANLNDIVNDELGQNIYPPLNRGFDFGGQWMHGYHCNPLTLYIQKLSTKAFDQVYQPSGGGAAYEGFKVKVWSEVTNDWVPDEDWAGSVEQFENIFTAAQGYASDVNNAADALKKYGAKNLYDLDLQTLMTDQDAYKHANEYTRSLFDLHMAFMLNTDVTEDGQRLSAIHTDHDVMLHEGGDAEVLLTGGLESAVQLIWASINNQVTLVPDTAVTAIDYTAAAAGVATMTLTTVDANTGLAAAPIQCGKIIVTVPLGVLKHGDITFTPALPAQKLAGMNRLGVGLMNKLFLVFDPTDVDLKTKWPKGQWEYSYGYAPKSGDIWFPNVINGYFVFGRPALVFLIGGDVARKMEREPLELIVSRAMPIARKLVGIPNLSRPVFAAMSKWESNPYARGSYTYVKPGADFDTTAKNNANPFYAYQSIIKSTDNTRLLIHFAGEGTAAARYGYADGAYMSGVRAATELDKADALSYCRELPPSAQDLAAKTYDCVCSETVNQDKRGCYPSWTVGGGGNYWDNQLTPRATQCGKLAGLRSRVKDTPKGADPQTNFQLRQRRNAAQKSLHPHEGISFTESSQSTTDAHHHGHHKKHRRNHHAHPYYRV